jgi:hypothetical protein
MIKFEVDSMQKVDFEAPKVEKEVTLHFILSVRDTGLPELTRYQRVIVTVLPKF